MTVSDLHADPEKMAAFMGWPYEGDEVEETEYDDDYRSRHRPRQVRRERTAAEVVQQAYRQLRDYNYQQYQNELVDRRQTHANFVRECAREALGIKGKSVDEVREKCIAMRPDLFSKDGEMLTFRQMPTSQPTPSAITPLPARKLRGTA